jgi:hypothetical protein
MEMMGSFKEKFGLDYMKNKGKKDSEPTQPQLVTVETGSQYLVKVGGTEVAAFFAEDNAVALQKRILAALAPAYVPQDMAREAYKMLEFLNREGEPNTLLALVQKAASIIKQEKYPYPAYLIDAVLCKDGSVPQCIVLSITMPLFVIGAERMDAPLTLDAKYRCTLCGQTAAEGVLGNTTVTGLADKVFEHYLAAHRRW